MEKYIANALNYNLNYARWRGDLNLFLKLTNYLNHIFGDRRFKVKPLVHTDHSMIIRYRGRKFYCYHDFINERWVAEYS